MAEKVYDIRLVRQKIERYCAYQERSQFEVEKKLHGFGLRQDTVDVLIAELIQKNFLNEMRFAEAFVSGKIRIKKWGKNKIKLKLKEKRVSKSCIEAAMKTIDGELYYRNLRKLAELQLQKYQRQQKFSAFELKAKLVKHLSSKGYEWDIINDVIDQMEITR